MADDSVTLERRGQVALMTLTRPHKKNALDEGMWRALDAALDDVALNLPRALVVTGAGESFCAGVDVSLDNPLTAKQMQGIQDRDRDAVHGVLARMRRTVDRLVDLPIPVIGAINGLAYGGGAEIATRFDLRVVDPAAQICFSEVRLGLMPDLGGGVALARLLGPARAADLILTARRFDGTEAVALGWATRLSAAGACLDEALGMADVIAKNGPRAVRYALRVLRAHGEISASAGLELELDVATDLILSGECLHGVTAMFSKSEPTFPDIVE
ncbi:MAG: enoyl-CoA hydratase/isomerase family protein [Polyangiaceae bacterium]